MRGLSVATVVVSSITILFALELFIEPAATFLSPLAMASPEVHSHELFSREPREESLCDVSRRALVEASSIRELVSLSEVPCVVEDKEAVGRFIHETIRTELPPRKMAMEEIAYQAIGLIPDSFDYQRGLVEFLVSQIGGYYNPKKKLFVMAGWLPAAVQSGVAVHELTHALQDQHYNLGALMNVQNATTDSGLAVSALIEGDASAVMFDYERRQRGQPRLSTASSIDGMLLLQVLGLGMGGEVPESLKTLLIFPYTSGLRFVHALLTKGGYGAVHQAYSRLPRTTREILHPEEYLSASFSAQIPAVEELEGRLQEVAPEYTDVLGEFGISSLFRGTASTKDRGVAAAVGWVGDRLAVFPAQNGVRVVSWLTRWESISDAEEFASLYREYRRNLGQTRAGEGLGGDLLGRDVVVTERDKEVSILIRERIGER